MKKILSSLAVAAAFMMAMAPASAITNGTVDDDSENDYVGQMRGFDPGGTQRQCSGALIGTGVFLTAGHCAVLTDVTLHFGADVDAAGALVVDATNVVRHPLYAGNFGFQYDVAVVLFDDNTSIEPGVLASEGFLDGYDKNMLREATFLTYGYGLHREGARGNELPLQSDGLRRVAEQSYLNMHNQYLGLSIHTNKNSGGGCFGDSGGPHLLDGVIVSVTSNGDGNCVATDNTQRVDQPGINDWLQEFLD